MATDRNATTAGVHNGACFCGAVKIEVHGEPAMQGYCHCESCRSHTGALVRGFTLWPKDTVKVQAGGF